MARGKNHLEQFNTNLEDVPVPVTSQRGVLHRVWGVWQTCKKERHVKVANFPSVSVAFTDQLEAHCQSELTIRYI